jgi:hypothetical protein
MVRRPALMAVAALAIFSVAPALAAANKPFELTGKAGVSNFHAAVQFLDQGVTCGPARLKELKKRVKDVAQTTIAHALEQFGGAGSAATKANEFFLIHYVASCNEDGGITFVNAAEDPFDNVNSYDPGKRSWQCVNRAGKDCEY